MTELIGADELRRRLGPADAVEAIVAALRGGLDPATDPARTSVAAGAGHLLLMPSAGPEFAGVKVVSVAPHGKPRVQGVYVLFDAATLAPVAVFDGGALTALRTPAVSVAAVRSVLPAGPLRVAVFGTGPQGRGHVDTLAAVRPLADVTYLGRRPADAVLARADVVVCATTARTPLFDSAVLPDRCVVLAVGSHEPDAREVDGALVARAQVVVEDVATARREAGDIVLAGVDPATLIPLRRAVTDPAALTADRPVLFKSTGMAWEDLVVAAAAHRVSSRGR